MSTIAKTTRFVSLTLVAPCRSVEIVAPTLARHLDIKIDEAILRLTSAPSVLEASLEHDGALRLARLLRAMGVQVELEDPALGPAPIPEPARASLSIQPGQTDNLSRLALDLLRWLPQQVMEGADLDSGRIEAALAIPGGLILPDLTDREINKTRRALRRISDVILVRADPRASEYDLMVPADTPIPDALRQCFKLLGLAPCKLSGAAAAGLDKTTADHVVNRFPKLGLTISNRDFQRFDLFLTGAYDVMPRELAEFLTIRSDLPQETLQQLPQPVKIDTGLTRATALAFQSDYASLGLETSIKLRSFHSVPSSPSEDRVAP